MANIGTQPAPARLQGFFASNAPVCVIARRGPSKHTRLILWDTEKDQFMPGQWFVGRVNHATLSSDGRYMAAGLMGVNVRRTEAGFEGEQVAVICKPPYVTALEAWVSGLCMMIVAFTPDDVLICPRVGRGHKVHARSQCPFARIDDTSGVHHEHEWRIVSGTKEHMNIDQRGRRILFENGCVYAEEGDKYRLLYDTNPMRFAPIEAPDWAKDW